MTRQPDIRNRKIGMSTQAPELLAVDALVLPWTAPDSEHPACSVRLQAGDAVEQEIGEYRGEREVMLTSAGCLPARFLFHLTMPGADKTELGLVEDRLRDCFFQAGVLGIQDIAITLQDFSVHVDSFADLVSRTWETCREFMARERGPRRLLLLVDDRDLRGQYLRHFLDRKEEEDRNWERMDGAAAVPNALAGKSGSLPNLDAPRRQSNAEQVLWLELPEVAADGRAAELVLEEALDDLLADYRAGRALAGSLARLSPAMTAALENCLSDRKAEDSLLDKRLRMLGSPLVMRLPWELLRTDDESLFLGEEHLFTRGTNFLHFRRRGGKQAAADSHRVSLRVMGELPHAQSLSCSVQELVISKELEVDWGTPETADARLVHCLNAGALDRLCLDEDVACELVFADLSPGEEGPEAESLVETAHKLLARGCRHVLAPLAPFRSSGERDAFRNAFYERLLAGATAGSALHYGQRVLMEAYGIESGWWLYRLHGQTDTALIPHSGRTRETMTLPG